MLALLGRSSTPAILEKKVWHVSKNLNFEKMKKASNIFLGSHDFTTFRASSCEAASPIRDIIYSELKKRNDEIIYVIKSQHMFMMPLKVIFNITVNTVHSVYFWP